MGVPRSTHTQAELTGTSESEEEEDMKWGRGCVGEAWGKFEE